MTLKVEVYQKEKVRPSSPTPQTLRYHKLSLLDVLAGPYYTPLILFYDSAAGSRRHDYDELRESLSKTLSVLYPLAGRLKDGSTIESNDEGADFVRANVGNYDLGEFFRRLPKLEDLRRLLPRDPYPDAIDPGMPMLAVQVNRFRCGGTAVAFCTWHGVVDAIGMAGFFNTWATINRGRGDSGGGLVVDASSIFSPGNLNTFQVVRTLFVGTMKKNSEKYTSKRFVFSKQDMERIRKQYSQSEHRRRPSRVEALSAFVWAAVIRATLVANPILKTHLLSHYVNLRKKLDPPLPSHCLGNIIQGTESVWEVAGGPVTARSLVGRVVEAIDKVTNDYVREMHTKGGFLRSIVARLRSKTTNYYNKDEVETLNISSLCNIPFGEVDFGWGKPIWIGMGHTLYDIALFVDTKDGGVEVWIGLKHEVMSNLDKDMEFHAYVSFAHIVSGSSYPLSSAL
ncbi:PREDICTED: vinorine synthase-like [Ipomoea nil]|uniref:vinorine synthase-like n=1 Tax=Ipomoea nil TaxID=35883 RepID=UPI00090187FA|nr:PREDICTED: vinorine synthase-like [Ipomoea nil]XP_019160742.1 PREDICTED: vinorine synthase-like [Ipomoea nil]